MQAEPTGAEIIPMISQKDGDPAPSIPTPTETNFVHTGRWLQAVSGAGDPSVPEFCTQGTHDPHDILRWVPEKIGIHKTEYKRLRGVRGYLKQRDVHILNGCIRDAILERPTMLPPELLRQKLDSSDVHRPLEDLRIFFPGTLFVNAGYFGEVGGIQWKGGRWVGITRRLEGSWEGELILTHEDAERPAHGAFTHVIGLVLVAGSMLAAGFFAGSGFSWG
jgi:hypothetical protein